MCWVSLASKTFPLFDLKQATGFHRANIAVIEQKWMGVHTVYISFVLWKANHFIAIVCTSIDIYKSLGLNHIFVVRDNCKQFLEKAKQKDDGSVNVEVCQ